MPNTHEFLFDVKLFAAIRVTAATEKEARAKLIAAIDCNTANLGAWPDGDPITCEVSLDKHDEDALSRIEDMNESPDEHSAKATAAYEEAKRVIAEAEGSTNG